MSDQAIAIVLTLLPIVLLGCIITFKIFSGSITIEDKQKLKIKEHNDDE